MQVMSRDAEVTVHPGQRLRKLLNPSLMRGGKRTRVLPRPPQNRGPQSEGTQSQLLPCTYMLESKGPVRSSRCTSGGHRLHAPRSRSLFLILLCSLGSPPAAWHVGTQSCVQWGANFLCLPVSVLGRQEASCTSVRSVHGFMCRAPQARCLSFHLR